MGLRRWVRGALSREYVRVGKGKKVEYLAYMKLTMQQGRFKMPYDQKLCTRMNEQRYEYSPSGQLRFWYPPGSHDDMLWAVALALWATKRDSDGVVVVK